MRLISSGKSPPSEVLSLPFFPYEYINIYPGTSLRFDPKIHTQVMTFFNKLSALNGDDPPRCIFGFRCGVEINRTGFYDVGIISEASLDGSDVIFLGKERAKIIKINPNASGGIRMVEFMPLKDEPEFQSLPKEDKPMVLGAIEATYKWLKKLEPLMEDGLMKKEVDCRIKHIESEIRNCRLAYALPWNVLVDFNNYLPKEDKVRFLKINGVVDRLQQVIDFIKLEIDVISCAEALAGEPEAPKKNIEDGVEGK